jgi:hypothetical protein
MVFKNSGTVSILYYLCTEFEASYSRSCGLYSGFGGIESETGATVSRSGAAISETAAFHEQNRTAVGLWLILGK